MRGIGERTEWDEGEGSPEGEGREVVSVKGPDAEERG